MAADNRIQIPLLTTGILNLDRVLGGGLPELSCTILAGGPGTGKTTLAQQMLFHLATAERPCLYFSLLGEPTVKLLRYQQQFGFFAPERVGREVFYIDLTDALQQGGVARALEVIGAQIKERSPILIAIDSFRAVEELAQTAGASLRTFTHNLALMLASWETTSLLIGEYQQDELIVKPEATVADGILWLSQSPRDSAILRKLQVVKLRGMAALAGQHPFRISTQGIQVYPHLTKIAEPLATQPEGRANFGVPGLDEMLRGGIPYGQTGLIAGSSGTGKTLLALHFLVTGAGQGEPGVLVTFEEHPQEQVRKAKSFGWDLASLQSQNLLRTIYLRPIDLSIDEVLGEINQATEAIGARRVVINSISGFELAVTAQKEEFREGLYRLVASLTSRGVSVLLTTEVSDLFGEVRVTTQGGISFIADNIILLRYAEIESALRKVLMVIKMRTSDHDKELRQYRIGPQGVVVEAPFSQYSGVLSGIPTLRTLSATQPYTPGLAPEEESLVYVLMSLREAGTEQLAESLNLAASQVQQMLDKLVDTGYVVHTAREGKSYYRVGMISPGGTPRRFNKRRGTTEP